MKSGKCRRGLVGGLRLFLGVVFAGCAGGTTLAEMSSEELSFPSKILAKGLVEVVYNTNGGHCEKTNEYVQRWSRIPVLPEVTRTGYECRGWYDNHSGFCYGYPLKSGSRAVTNMNKITLHAWWKVGTQKVVFYENWKQGATTTNEYTMSGAYGSFPTASRASYSFNGWWTASNGGKQVKETDNVTTDTLRVLYAHWELSLQKVTFDANGGICIDAAQTYSIGQPYGTLPKPERENYDFDGWWTAPTGGECIDETAVVPLTETRTLYAHWLRANQVVGFYANGGNCETSSHTYAVGSPYEWLPVAEREGSVFCGWYDLEGNERVNETNTVTASQTRWLYAQWNNLKLDETTLSACKMVKGTNAFNLDFIGVRDKTYALQRSRSLGTESNWRTVSLIEAEQTGVLTVKTPTPRNWHSGFFRVKEAEDGDSEEGGIDGDSDEYESDRLYLVLDLAAGHTNGVAYPASFLNKVPEGGWGNEFKTTKLVLRLIQPGTFTMGGRTNELGAAEDAVPHLVTISRAFYIGVFEVTQKQWEQVMGTRPSCFTNELYYKNRPVEQVSYNDIRGSSAGTAWPGSDEVDAASFMGKFRARTSGFAWDLPTEAQWEYACRAGTITSLNSGEDLSGLETCTNMSMLGRYWFNGGQNYSPSCDTAAGTADVGSYLPNAWGLYDMHGNVLEWCLDWYDSYSIGTSTNPLGSASGVARVLRGGGWLYNAQYCRSAHRSKLKPSYGSNYIGFRLVCPADLP